MVKTDKKMKTWLKITLIILGSILIMCSVVVITNVIRGYISRDFRAELDNFVEIYVSATEDIEIGKHPTKVLESLNKSETEEYLYKLEESYQNMLAIAKHRNEIDVINRIPEYIAQLQEFVDFKDSPAKEKPYGGFNHDVRISFETLEMYKTNLIEDPTRI